MTSRSASVKFHPWRHAFKIALREGAACGALGALLLALALIAPVFSFYNRLNGNYQVVYVYGESSFLFVYPLLAALLGLTQALFSFRLLVNRSASNVYFGLGLSRRQVFDARFAAGALWLAAAVFVAMGGGAVVNLCYSGHAGLILSRAFYLGAGLLVSALTAYAVMAAACTRTGTLAEAAVYGLLALLLPTLLLSGLSGQMHAFLRGFPYGYDTRYSSMQNFELPGTLASNFTVLNPLLFFKPAFQKYAIYIADLESYSSGTEALSWGPTLLWLAAAAALTALARRSFAVRRVENTGLLGTCRPLAIAVTVPAVWAAASAFLSITDGYMNLSLAAALAAGGALAAAVAAALYFPLRVAERGAWRSLWALPATLAAAGLSVALLAGGGFGYAGYVPDAGAVASVEITYKGLPGLVPSRDYSSIYLVSYENNGQLTLTDPNDVALACALHRSLAAAGADEGISNYTLVRYTLKDGRTMTRFYRAATAETLRTMLALDDTAAYAGAVAAAFEGPAADPDAQRDYSHPESSFAADAVYLAGPLSTQAVLLDADTMAAVRQAIAEDLRSQSADARYFPAEAETCTLYFFSDRWGESPYFPATAAMNTLDQLGWTAGMATLAVDAAYPRTLAVLAGYLPQIQASDIEWVRLGPDYADVLARHTMNPNVSSFFQGFAETQDGTSYEMEEAASYAGGLSAPITDPGRITQLYAASRSFGFAADGGRLLYVKLKDADQVTVRLIPPDLLPDWAALG